MSDWKVTLDIGAEFYTPVVVVVGGGCVSVCAGGGGFSSFFFSVGFSEGGGAVVSVEGGGGGAVSVSGGIVLVMGGGGGGAVSVRGGVGRGAVVRGGATPTITLPLVSCGSVPAIVPGWPVVVVPVATPGRLKFDVVSAFVPVIETGGGRGSPGALIVEVTLLVCPSCTTS